ncbi:MAG TPA: hypothetical protein VGJ92_12195, partial [Methanocella sp.]
IMQNVNFDWLYVKDLLPVAERFVREDPAANVYNVTSGRAIDLLSVANMINAGSDYKSEILVENPGMNREYSGSNERLLRDFGGVRFTDMGDAIAELSDYYRRCMDSIDCDVIRQDPYAAGCKVSLPGK